MSTNPTPLVFNKNLEVEYGRVDRLSPLIRRVVANNPGPFTFKGTGTYIIGNGRVAVIDPGPDDPAHLAALDAALEGETVTHILITHTHGDHSPGARPLQERTGAPTYGFGPHPESDEPADDITEPTADAVAANAANAANAAATGQTDETPKETHDALFVPDVAVRDGDLVVGDGWTVECVHTPGHLANHICYSLTDERVLFSGDHVMGWSTSVVSPPGGDMADYLASLEKLLGRDDATYWPTHGPAITDPHPFVRGLIEHRRNREREILGRLADGDRRIADIVAALYVGLDTRLVKAAGRSVLGHLRQLAGEGRVTWEGQGDRPMVDSEYRLAP